MPVSTSRRFPRSRFGRPDGLQSFLARAWASRSFQAAEYCTWSRNTSVFSRSICGKAFDELEDRAVDRGVPSSLQRGEPARAVVDIGGPARPG